MTTALERRRARARRLLRLQRISSWALAIFASLALVVGLPWLVWQGPYLLDAAYIDTATLGAGTGSAALVTGLRTALVACVAAIGAGMALLYTVRNYRLTRRGQITDRFTKALERLGSAETYVRIGGVLALEQIIQDAPEQATHAARVLGHFVRDRAPAGPPPPYDMEQRSTGVFRFVGRPSNSEPTASNVPLPRAPEADVQVALTALTRSESRTHVDSSELLRLGGLHLRGCDLAMADLTGALLICTDLTNADLWGADLTGAALEFADLTEADLTNSDLTGASLIRAKLIGADLTTADLTSADLAGADFTHADLLGAKLTGTDLTGADLTRVKHLDTDELKSALITELTKLPPGTPVNPSSN
ncbi:MULTISPECIES: pentapeptide repeat-containing protein [Streptomyces]|uniref:pentapeptide repeat-containing protein n=1 Tax=Streptomyces TaxID=1883 RepID=UPI00287F997D|nr:pentapeptide repeat-containing protein [Streptomyces sp. CGMCC 4.1456]WNF67188.1 pentapeptide repeat-containing protein [Streptomyces sp. CGMCC 4.1456]